MKYSRSCLLIDDDHDDQLAVLIALKELDQSIDLIAEDNGFTALKKLEQDSDFKPDVIFLDLNLPGINGIDCLVRIKANAKLTDIPVIIYTTSARNEDVIRAKKFGATAFITKPFLVTELADQLKPFF